MKLIYFLILLIPLIGPLIYLFLSEEIPPQSDFLKNNGPKGSYADRMISIKAIIEASIEEDDLPEKKIEGE